MGFMESFCMDGISIETVVMNEFETNEIDHFISCFMRPDDRGTKVFGFDIEWYELPTESHCACAIILCGGNLCVLLHLTRSAVVPQPLVNFLNLPNFKFVGFGIKESLAKLEKEYGIRCRNAVELGPLAATVLARPLLCYCGVDELASLVCQIDLRKHRPLSTTFIVCDRLDLSKSLVKMATINAYSYHKIGSKLLEKCSLSLSNLKIY